MAQLAPRARRRRWTSWACSSPLSPRRGTPRSYLPVELGAGTATVLVALTNLGREPRDALHFPVPNVDAARSEAHAARLVFELVSD